MIKAVVQHKDGRPMVVVGLSAENWRCLRAGYPIVFDCAELGIPENGHIAIVGGATEQSIKDQLVSKGMNLLRRWGSEVKGG